MHSLEIESFPNLNLINSFENNRSITCSLHEMLGVFFVCFIVVLDLAMSEPNQLTRRFFFFFNFFHIDLLNTFV